MIADVKQELRGLGLRYRVEGARFDEVLFADDSICISENTRALNRMLKAIEEIGMRSGMKLNNGKCEAIVFGGKAQVHWQDKTMVKVVERAKYLGCVMSRTNNSLVEVRGRIREAMTVLKKMHTFWRHSNCKIQFKLTVIQAILYSKILYGLESAELNPTALKALDVFQLKCLRKICLLYTSDAADE